MFSTQQAPTLEVTKSQTFDKFWPLLPRDIKVMVYQQFAVPRIIYFSEWSCDVATGARLRAELVYQLAEYDSRRPPLIEYRVKPSSHIDDVERLARATSEFRTITHFKSIGLTRKLAVQTGHPVGGILLNFDRDTLVFDSLPALCAFSMASIEGKRNQARVGRPRNSFFVSQQNTELFESVFTRALAQAHKGIRYLGLRSSTAFQIEFSDELACLLTFNDLDFLYLAEPKYREDGGTWEAKKDEIRRGIIDEFILLNADRYMETRGYAIKIPTILFLSSEQFEEGERSGILPAEEQNMDLRVAEEAAKRVQEQYDKAEERKEEALAVLDQEVESIRQQDQEEIAVEEEEENLRLEQYRLINARLEEELREIERKITELVLESPGFLARRSSELRKLQLEQNMLDLQTAFEELSRRREQEKSELKAKHEMQSQRRASEQVRIRRARKEEKIRLVEKQAQIERDERRRIDEENESMRVAQEEIEFWRAEDSPRVRRIQEIRAGREGLEAFEMEVQQQETNSGEGRTLERERQREYVTGG